MGSGRTTRSFLPPIMAPSDFKNANIDEIVEKLTTEEAINLIAGVGFWHTHKIERLGIPAVKVSPSSSSSQAVLMNARSAMDRMVSGETIPSWVPQRSVFRYESTSLEVGTQTDISAQSATALGATFDPELVKTVGLKLIAEEAKLRAASIVLAPTCNIQRVSHAFFFTFCSEGLTTFVLEPSRRKGNGLPFARFRIHLTLP